MASCKTTSNNNQLQKFQAVTEKLRLEIQKLENELQNEKQAYRQLKSSNEQQLRKHKSALAEQEQSFRQQLNEKLRQKTQQNKSGLCSSDSNDTNCDNCRKLRDANKEVEEKLQKVIEADRLKAADLRTQHDSHLIEIQKLQRSTRHDTQRLLEEIKTKDRLIDHLRQRKHGTTKSQTEPMRKLVKELPPPPPPPLTPLPPDENDPTPNALHDHQTEPPEPPVVPNTAYPAAGNKETNLTINKSVSEPRTVITEVTTTVATNDYCHTITSTCNNSSNETGSPSVNIMPPAVNDRLTFGADNATDFQKQFLRDDDSTPITVTNNEENRFDQPLSNKHRKEAYYRSLMNCDSVEEDTDSAVSSAPSSLSPQPYHPISQLVPNFDTYNSVSSTPETTKPPTSIVFHENTPFHNHQKFTAHPTQSPWFHPPNDHHSDQSGENTDVDDEDKGDLQSELAIAKRQVRELERALLVTREVKVNPNSNHSTKQNEVGQMAERVRRLEAREVALLAEIQDLREQNELQEFRILELEECHEKWSLRSQSSSELRDIESSRLTPIQDNTNTIIEYKGDVVREHLMLMSKKATDPDDKHCLQQVLTLLDNLETLSQEHVHCLEEYSGDFYQKPIKTPTMLHLIDDDKAHFKKKQLSNASSLQESGIFEGDHETFTIGTQTESARNDLKLSELTAEIQKLNQIRESIEEKNKSTQNCIDFSAKLKLVRELDYYKNRMELLEQKILVYETAPKEAQMKEFEKHLNNEIYLNQQLKEMKNEIRKLKAINMELEEVKCEFEEAENDTRLYSQQLEFDLKIQHERLLDLEETYRVNKRKIKDLKQQQIYWERLYDERNFEFEERETESQTKIDFLQNIIPILIVFNLFNYVKVLIKPQICSKKVDREVQATEVIDPKMNNFEIEFTKALKENEKLIKTVKCLEDNYKNLLNKTLPEEPIVVYEHNSVLAIEKEFNQALVEKDKLIKTIKRLEDNYTNLLNKRTRKTQTSQEYYQQKITELVDANKEMKKQLELLEQREIAYIETLQQADNIWAEMEAGYKKRITDAEDAEAQLRTQVRQLEENDHKLRKSIIPLNERIIELEDVEKKLEERCALLERENKYLHKDNHHLTDELNCAKLEWRNIKDNLEGSLHNEMDRLRKKIRQFQEEIDISTKVLEQTEEIHQKDISVLKMQLNKANKELVHLDISNSELREEITQMETRISELQTALLEQRISSERTIKSLSSELAQFSDRQFMFKNKRSASYSGIQQAPMSLREELRASQSAGGSTQSMEINDDGLKMM